MGAGGCVFARPCKYGAPGSVVISGRRTEEKESTEEHSTNSGSPQHHQLPLTQHARASALSCRWVLKPARACCVSVPFLGRGVHGKPVRCSLLCLAVNRCGNIHGHARADIVCGSSVARSGRAWHAPRAFKPTCKQAACPRTALRAQRNASDRCRDEPRATGQRVYSPATL